MKAEANSGSPVLAAELWPAFQCSSLSLELFILTPSQSEVFVQERKDHSTEVKTLVVISWVWSILRETNISASPSGQRNKEGSDFMW